MAIATIPSANRLPVDHPAAGRSNMRYFSPFIRLPLVLIIGMPLLATASSLDPHSEVSDPLDKITFDLNTVNDQGLRGPADGRVHVAYEFCIPASQSHAEKVIKIDPSIKIFRHSKGRIGCNKDQYLCIGHTGQKDFRAILHRLTTQDYIARIDECLWE
jgi:hypothetical protein